MHLVNPPKFYVTIVLNFSTTVIPRRNWEQWVCIENFGDKLGAVRATVKMVNYIDHQHGRHVTWVQTKNTHEWLGENIRRSVL